MLCASVQICSHNILGQLQLDDVWFCLLRHATKAANSPDDSRLHYDDFCQVICQWALRCYTLDIMLQLSIICLI
jgi:hypothetical protein